MNALQAIPQPFEAPTADAMNRVCMMFQIATSKEISAEEGYTFLSLWNMIAKTPVSTVAITPPQPAAITVDELPPVSSPEKPKSAPSSELAKSSPAPETMPHVEEIALPGIEQPMRRVASSFRNNSPYWVEGYLWRINVVPFDRDKWGDSYFVHFKEKPTQAEFNEHYQHFLADENRCKVHVLESNGTTSRRITDEYCSFRERGELNFHSRETLHPSDEWEQGSRFRAVFFDTRIGGKKNYLYFPNKPTQAQIDDISNVKGCVIVETRPKDHD
ncbi:TPA: hypothetical protein ACOEOW_003903 [Enterobacter hormaechei subsp. xiangfangensis]